MSTLLQALATILNVSGDCSNSSETFPSESSTTNNKAARSSSTWPQDVDPESGFRLPLPRRDDLDDDEKKVYDKLADTDSRRLAGLRGPSGIRLYNPKLAEKANALSRYLRFESGVSEQIREVAILITAREMNSRFEWAAHEPEALRQGVPQEIIDVIKYRKSLAGLTETDAVIIQFSRQMFGPKKVDSETFAQALEIFGPKKLVVLVDLMAHYSATAALLCAFDVQLGPDQKALLPLP